MSDKKPMHTELYQLRGIIFVWDLSLVCASSPYHPTRVCCVVGSAMLFRLNCRRAELHFSKSFMRNHLIKNSGWNWKIVYGVSAASARHYVCMRIKWQQIGVNLLIYICPIRGCGGVCRRHCPANDMKKGHMCVQTHQWMNLKFQLRQEHIPPL